MHRLMIEARVSASACFATLTYRDSNLIEQCCIGPTGPTLATLKPAHLQSFLKRLRIAIYPSRIRFFAVGEYGERTWRPHFHLALYGYPPCPRGLTRTVPGKTEPDWQGCCSACSTLGKAWGHGHVLLGTLTRESAGYIAGYVVKKLTSSDDERLKGRHPEFTRMSLRPGIGAFGMDDVASVLLEHELGGDVPGVLRHNGKLYPLGRYLRGRLRERVGMDKGAPDVTLREMEERLRSVREGAFENSRSFSEAIAEHFAGDRASVEARYNIFKQRKGI